jgi:hypothetical protein
MTIFAAQSALEGTFRAGAGANSVFGPGAASPTQADSFAQGTGSAAPGAHSFAQGTNLYTGYTCFSQGYGYSTTHRGAAGYASFAQGAAVSVAGDYSFGQGGWYISTLGNRVFAQGNGIYQTQAGTDVFAQGSDITLTGGSWGFMQGRSLYKQQSSVVFMQGYDLKLYGDYSSNDVFMQGSDIDLLTLSKYVFVQGREHSSSGNLWGSLIQGRNVSLTSTTSYCLIQGAYNEVYSLASSIVQGFGITIASNVSRIIAQGGTHTFAAGVSNSFAQGYTHTFAAGVSNSFAQGQSIVISGNRCFAQGHGPNAIRDDQKTWGSNRGLPVGSAQSSRLVKHVATLNATPVALATLDLETDKTYLLRVGVSARNTTTNTESASFIIGQATAYRDTAGSAVLVSSPVTLTAQNSGGGSTAWSVELASSGNNILLNVTGDATDRVEWCCDFEFVEVAG